MPRRRTFATGIMPILFGRAVAGRAIHVSRGGVARAPRAGRSLRPNDFRTVAADPRRLRLTVAERTRLPGCQPALSSDAACLRHPGCAWRHTPASGHGQPLTDNAMGSIACCVQRRRRDRCEDGERRAILPPRDNSYRPAAGFARTRFAASWWLARGCAPPTSGHTASGVRRGASFGHALRVEHPPCTLPAATPSSPPTFPSVRRSAERCATAIGAGRTARRRDADREHRPDQRVRLDPAHADSRQGQGAHRDLGLLVRPALAAARSPSPII